jgi:hypothetical protein
MTREPIFNRGCNNQPFCGKSQCWRGWQAGGQAQALSIIFPQMPLDLRTNSALLRCSEIPAGWPCLWKESRKS